MHLAEIIEKFEGVKQLNSNSYQCLCPAHNDKEASLTITEENDKILLYCHAECDLDKILDSVGLNITDLFNNKNEITPISKIEDIYIYTDENNNALYQVIRYTPKRFIQAKFCNNQLVYNMKNVRYVLYNLPQVLNSDVIYFVEGEKDANNLNSIGLTATTSVGGAAGFKKHAEEYCQALTGKTVYIIPDNDTAGKNYAEKIYSALLNNARKVKILNLVDEIPDFKEKGDISDVLQEFGKTRTLEIIEKLKNKENTIKVFPIQDADELNEENFEKILNFLDIQIKYNLITKRIIVSGMPPKYATADLYTILPIYLKNILRNRDIKINDTKKIEEFITLEISKNNFNPILDLFDSHNWDGINRYNEICNIFHLDNEFHKTLLIKWLQQTVAMLLNTLDKPFGAEGILTLQGKQGIGKSRILSLLALNPEWMADGVVIDMNNKDSIIKATSRWISELGELDDTIRKEQSALKAFITSPEDDIRQPYAKTSTRRPRNTSFCASVNPISFLKDDENRRFWVIHIEKIDYQKLEKLGTSWILQLWLQVYHDVKKDINCFRLTDAEKALLQKNNLRYMEFIPYEEELLSMIDFQSTEKSFWSNREIINKLLPNATAQAVGKAINRIENNYPDAVKIKRTSKGVSYLMKIKDEFTNKSK